MIEQYRRINGHDKRFQWGDDYAADGWLDINSGKIVEVVVGFNPNEFTAITSACLSVHERLTENED